MSRLSPQKRTPIPAKCLRSACSHNDNGPRHGAPILRHSHQTPAANTKHAPSGSGTRNAPHAARVTGDLIVRIFITRARALLSEARTLTND
jgi:hypothetical protein